MNGCLASGVGEEASIKCVSRPCRSRYQFVIGVLGLVGRNCRFQLQNRCFPWENGNPQLPLLSGQKSRGRTLRLGKKVDVCTFSGLTPPLTSQPSFPSYANKVYPTTLSYQGVTPNPHVTLIIE